MNQQIAKKISQITSSAAKDTYEQFSALHLILSIRQIQYGLLNLSLTNANANKSGSLHTVKLFLPERDWTEKIFI